MRRNVVIKTILGVMLFVAAGCATTVAAAEENRFKCWIEEGGLVYRFDNQTGEIHKLLKPATGPAAWVKCDIVEPKASQQTARTQILSTIPVVSQNQPQQYQPIPTNSYASPTPIASRNVSHSTVGSILDAESMILPSINDERRTPSAPVAPVANASGSRRIEIFDDLGNQITDRIDDSDRAANRPTINAYEPLHVSSTLKTSGDRISGIVILDNKGNRRISLMELTITVRVVGKEKPIEHKRYTFTDTSADKPPVPSFGASGMSILKKIDVPTPAGVINGMPEVHVTYLKFDERE